MRSTSKLQFLTCLMLYASSVQAIMVKFGTKGGPIEPPTPEPELPAPQPYRAPAPVWESRSNDAPDPNAQWRPQLFQPNPQPIYTQVYQAPAPAPIPLNNAQRFVNSYIPTNRAYQPQPPQNYFTPTQFLSSQSLPGIGLRYFVPVYVNDQSKVQHRQEDAKLNHLESNDVGGGHDSASDSQWKYEKEATRRTVRTAEEAVAGVPYYIWPAYVPPRHQNHY